MSRKCVFSEHRTFNIKAHGADMIISASRRTDIPAFYGDWLMNRLRAGYCLVPNPYNHSQISRVSLRSDDVDAIVFWSKNPRPLMSHLAEIDELGYRYCFLFTLNRYSLSMEPLVPAFEERVAAFRELASRLGAGRVVWRYDPVILSETYTAEYHLETFKNIATALNGYTRRVIISFVDYYKKTERRLRELEKETADIFCRDVFKTQELNRLVEGFNAAASDNGMSLQSCAEDSMLGEMGILPGKCIDDIWLNRLLGTEITSLKDKGQREACGCVKSRDIGVSNTCLHGCRYCYSTTSHGVAVKRNREHISTAESL